MTQMIDDELQMLNFVHMKSDGLYSGQSLRQDQLSFSSKYADTIPLLDGYAMRCLLRWIFWICHSQKTVLHPGLEILGLQGNFKFKNVHVIV